MSHLLDLTRPGTAGPPRKLSWQLVCEFQSIRKILPSIFQTKTPSYPYNDTIHHIIHPFDKQLKSVIGPRIMLGYYADTGSRWRIRSGAPRGRLDSLKRALCASDAGDAAVARIFYVEGSRHTAMAEAWTTEEEQVRAKRIVRALAPVGLNIATLQPAFILR